MTEPSEPDDLEANDLEPKQQRAIIELMTARTLQEAAERAGVGERSLRRWLRRDDFRRAYGAAQREAFEHASGRIQQLASEAVDALSSILKDTTAPHAVRANAARAVLDAAVRGHERAQMLERIETLERMIAASAESAGTRRH